MRGDGVGAAWVMRESLSSDLAAFSAWLGGSDSQCGDLPSNSSAPKTNTLPYVWLYETFILRCGRLRLSHLVSRCAAYLPIVHQDNYHLCSASYEKVHRICGGNPSDVMEGQPVSELLGPLYI